MSPLSATATAALSLTAALSSMQLLAPVEAHGYVSLPRASYANSYTKTGYNSILTPSAYPAFQGYKWNGSPEDNAKAFTEAFRAGGFSSLRALLDPAAPGCGNSRTDVPPVDVSGLSVMQFQNDEEGKGFVSSHHGPCEAWIDGTRVFHGNDCRAQFAGYPATIPINYTACSSGQMCVLTFYWLALHEPNWQVYKQCVPIKRGGSARNLRQ